MIIVTGMHRSGTSAVSQLLSAWGVDFGPEESLVAADRWNERGYVESKRVLDVNSRIVTGWPRSCGGPRALLGQLAYLRRPGAAAIDRRAGRHRETLGELVNEYADRAVKDPRFCLTLRHWREAREPDRIVLCLRSPGAVAASLKRRQRVPLRVGLRFWEYHWSALLGQIDGLGAHWIRFEDLWGKDRYLVGERLAVYLGVELSSKQIEESSSRTFVDALVHAGAAVPAAEPTVARLWKELCDRAAAVR